MLPKNKGNTAQSGKRSAESRRRKCAGSPKLTEEGLPGFAGGTFDRDAVFRALVGRRAGRKTIRKPADPAASKCGGRMRTQLRPHAVLEDFPLFCPKHRYSCVIRFWNGKIEEWKQPDA